MKQSKPAHELTVGEKLVRFGHLLPIKSVATRIHPLTGKPTVSVTHIGGTVDFTPETSVQVC